MYNSDYIDNFKQDFKDVFKRYNLCIDFDKKQIIDYNENKIEEIMKFDTVHLTKTNELFDKVDEINNMLDRLTELKIEIKEITDLLIIINILECQFIGETHDEKHYSDVKSLKYVIDSFINIDNVELTMEIIQTASEWVLDIAKKRVKEEEEVNREL